MTNSAGFSDQVIMSIRSRLIAFETLCTRDPRIPTHAPTGSILGSFERTAIFARDPGSRAAPSTSITPCPTSGTSNWNSWTTSSGVFRSRTSCGPRESDRTSVRMALMRSPLRNASRSIHADRGRAASTPSISTMASRLPTRLTTPCTMSPCRSLNSS